MELTPDFKILTTEDIIDMDMQWLKQLSQHSHQLIGQAILPTIHSIVVQNYELSLKITGMLLDLPLDEVYLFLSDYKILFFRVQEAFWALEY